MRIGPASLLNGGSKFREAKNNIESNDGEAECVQRWWVDEKGFVLAEKEDEASPDSAPRYE